MKENKIILEVKDLPVEVSGKPILKDINLIVHKDEVLILFGPNGSGKTTLIKTIMGLEGYHVRKGEIIFNGVRLNDLTTQQRVKSGIGIMYQHPPKIRGVKLFQIAQFLSKDADRIKQLSERLSLNSHLPRELNLGFSGGEIKRSELFQLLLQDPEFVLLDEPESGVDLENISVMGAVLNEFLQKKEKSAFIITHTGYILDYVKAKKGCVMISGKFWCVGSPKEMFENIRKEGYEKCRECDERKNPVQ